MIKSIYTESADWQNKISNICQVGGIETSVLDNGAGRGVRIAWVNTGSGLRYKVVLDRGCDIMEAFFGPYSLAWISHAGTTSPNSAAYQGVEWLRSFGGGLLTTCGLAHVGGPENSENDIRGLHDRFSNLPAELKSIVQPEIENEQFLMSITSVIRQTSALGDHLELTRTISSRLGESKIYITDHVVNKGNTIAPHMLLYHFNIGWPLLDEGAQIIYNGKADILRSADNHAGDQLKTCPSVLSTHNGNRENVIAVDVVPDQHGFCSCGINNPKLGIELRMKYKKDQLPWFINWQHFGQREYLIGLEPSTNLPIGQKKAEQDGSLIFLAPGEKRSYEIQLELITFHNE